MEAESPGDQATALITLGSGSPRRAELLDQLGVAYVVETCDIDEAALVDPGEPDLAVQVARIARAKFAAFGQGQPALLLTADTLVACNGVALGKPASDEEAAVALRMMSGQVLTISSALCFGERGTDPDLRVVSTLVKLVELADDTIAGYVASGEGRDKAGGLALQSQAGAFIDRIDGCWPNVVALPLCQVADLLSAHVPMAATAANPSSCTPELCRVTLRSAATHQ